MGEIYTDCEEKCIFFKVLSLQLTNLNRMARQATREGKEFPGSINTLCGLCIKGNIIDSSLEEKKKEILNLK